MHPDPRDPEIEAAWRAVAASGARSLAVLAAEAGEGATSLAGALARRAAAGGARVLLVDCGGGASGGGPGAAPGAILPVAGGVALLGDPGPAATGAWRDPPRLAEQLEAWRGEWDLVLLDPPPLLAGEAAGVPAAAVAAAAEASILVVLAGRTAASTVAEAEKRLARAGARLLGTVLNDRDNPSLLAEMEREAGRLSRIAPGPVRWLKARLRRSSLLGLRV